MRRIVTAIRKRDANEAFRCASTYVKSAKDYVQSVMREDAMAEKEKKASGARSTKRRGRAIANSRSEIANSRSES